MVMSYLGNLVSNLVTTTSPRALSPVDLSYALRSVSLISERDPFYKEAQEYYDGKQSDPREIDFGERTVSLMRTFRAAHNFCGLAIDALVERLEVTGFAVSGDGISEEQGGKIAELLWSWWQASLMDEQENTIHAQAFVKGDSYVLVEMDHRTATPRFSFQDALVIAPVYNAYHQMTACYKAWSETYDDDQGRPRIRQRVTVYEPSLIRKYANEGKGFVPYGNDLDSRGQPDGGLIDWRDARGEPLGIPVIHFANKARGGDFGRSELVDLIAPQDEINRRIWYASEAASYAGSPQKYVIDGVEPKSPWVSGAGRVWTIGSLDKERRASAGQFDSVNVAQLEDATDREIKRFAAIARVPVHLIWAEGDLPSGEALKTAEAPLVAKVEDRITTFSTAWEAVMRMAVKLHNTFGTGPALPDTLALTTQWASAESRSLLTDEQVLALQAEDLSWEERMRRRGYDAERIEQLRAEREKEGQGALAQADAEFKRLAAARGEVDEEDEE